MRCFVAIDITAQAKEAIAIAQSDLQKKLKLKTGSIRWTLPEQMHLTLKFLGELGQNDVEKIGRLLPGIVAGREAFEIEMGVLGFFGMPVKVLFAEAAEENVRLNSLQTNIENVLASEGFARENRPFRSHLTLGRIKNGTRDRKLKDAIINYGPLAIPAFRANAVCLYQSQLTPEKAIYTLLNKTEYP
ncbi:MAG: RNA 2',3'-cyclic phosphodiesterase [Anaerohalosphaeraceae bacterium]|nr:RNA 2',3'-cyclic phosphodiesterase [Anaerohalosphaeraceae bacterium]